MLKAKRSRPFPLDSDFEARIHGNQVIGRLGTEKIFRGKESSKGYR